MLPNQTPPTQVIEKGISITEAQEIALNINVKTLKKLIAEGKIRSHRLGNKYLFFASELMSDLKSL